MINRLLRWLLCKFFISSSAGNSCCRPPGAYLEVNKAQRERERAIFLKVFVRGASPPRHGTAEPYKALGTAQKSNARGINLSCNPAQKNGVRRKQSFVDAIHMQVGEQGQTQRKEIAVLRL